MGVWTYFNDWLKRPFSQDMDTLHWFLFVGLVIVLAWMWHYLILRHIIAGIE